MALMQLNGPALIANLPCQWQDEYAQSALEASRYLAVLAEFERENPLAEPDLSPLLSAKLDLALLWLARRPNPAPSHGAPVTLGLEEIAWHTMHALSPVQRGALVVQLSEAFPFALQLPAEVTSCQTDQTGFVIRARLQWQNEELQDWYERTVFRYHRRDIQHRREA